MEQDEQVRTSPLYVNVFSATVGPFDITLDLGYKSPEQSGSAEFRLLSRVSMSLSHAKAMMQIMQALIQQYERDVGPIPMPRMPGEGKEG